MASKRSFEQPRRCVMQKLQLKMKLGNFFQLIFRKYENLASFFQFYSGSQTNLN